MPSASTTLCVECETQRSKYTCPACKARTCSLECTKRHKSPTAARHTCSGVATASSSTTSTTAIASTVSPRQQHTAVGGRSGDNGVLEYVPMAEYSESHLLKDYLFLSALSRTTVENGRRIVSLNLLPPSTSSSDANQSKHQHHSNSGVASRLTNQQRQREQLIKQLHYRKYKVMVLPEGMARRKQNLSAFNGKDKKFHLSVELKFACSQEKQQESVLLHKQPPERTIQELVLNELQHRSFANKKELGKLSKSPNAHVVSSSVLAQVGLPIPWQVEERQGREQGETLLVLEQWPEQEWAVVVPAYSNRLTNESTTRYLEWWTRKRRWEEANPELAAQQLQQKENRPGYSKDGEPPIKRDSTEYQSVREEEWAYADRVPNANFSEAATTSAVAETGVMGGIVSSSLLSMLSQRLGRTSSHSTPTPTPIPLPTPTPSAQSSKQLSPSAVQPCQPTTHHPAIEEEHNINTASILVHPISPGSTTLDWMLRTLPNGYSVVELPELRVVSINQLSQMRKSVTLIHVDSEQDAKYEKREAIKTPQQKASIVKTVTSGSLGSLLTGYDSESDSEQTKQITPHNQQQQDEQETKDHPNSGASLAHLASLHGFLPPTPSSS